MTLYIVNTSTLLTDEALIPIVAAIQLQVIEHLQPAWNVAAVLQLAKAEAVPAGAARIFVVDTSTDAGALGEHDWKGAPTGFAAVKDAADDATPFSSVLSHEILELLVDPEIIRLMQVGDLVLPLEVCLAGDTQIAMLDSSQPTIQALADRGGAHVLWSVNKNGEVVAAHGVSARQTGKNRAVVRVQLTDGTFVRCTAEHRFLLADGTYRTAKQLTPGTVLFSDISPVRSATHAANRRLPDVVPFCQRGSGLSARADSSNVLLSELVHPVFLANTVPITRHTVLSRSVEHVLMVRTEKEMRRIHARGVVARMTNLQPFGGFRPVVEGIRDTMRRKSMSLLSNLPISERVQGAGPNPTGLRLSDTRPKTVFKRRTTSVVSIKPWLRVRSSGSAKPLIMNDAQPFSPQNALALRNRTNLHTKVVYAVEPDGNEDVYDLTIPQHHNFLVAAGVFVHNCDATEGAPYDLNGVLVENFVLPAYYVKGAPPPYDHCGVLSQGAPALALGGYGYSAKLGEWTQQTAERARAAKRRPAPPWSRRGRR